MASNALSRRRYIIPRPAVCRPPQPNGCTPGEITLETDQLIGGLFNSWTITGVWKTPNVGELLIADLTVSVRTGQASSLAQIDNLGSFPVFCNNMTPGEPNIMIAVATMANGCQYVGLITCFVPA